MTYSVRFWSIYLPEDECYTDATYVKENTWKVTRAVIDALYGKNIITTAELAQAIHDDWFSDGGGNSFEYPTEDETMKNSPGYQELNEAVEILLSRTENEYWESNIDPEDEKMWQDHDPRWEEKARDFKRQNRLSSRIIWRIKSFFGGK